MNAQQNQFSIRQEVGAERRLKEWLLALSGEFIQLRPDLAPGVRAWQKKLKADFAALENAAQLSRTWDSVLIEEFRKWDGDKGGAARGLRRLATEGEVTAILDALESRGKRDPNAPLTGLNALPAPARSTSHPAFLLFTNDLVHGAAVRSFARAGDWEPGNGMARALSHQFANKGRRDFKLRNVEVTVGLPNTSASLWEFLRGEGPGMVKAHYALFARYYDQTHDGLGVARESVAVSIAEFCDDIGFTKHHNGGHRPENKKKAKKMLEALTSVEMSCSFTVPNGEKGRIKGRLWELGMVGEKLDQKGGEVGTESDAPASAWEPIAFTFSPGDWYQDAEWRSQQKYVGKIGSGIMKLQTHKDQWAILIGGYLGAQARVGRYKTLRFRIETLLREVGLAASERAQGKHAELWAKLIEALDKLVEVGVIFSWRRLDENEPDDVDDFDDVEALSAYGAAAQHDAETPRDWRARVLEITFPLDDDRARLEASAAKSARKRGASTRKKTAPKSQNSEK